MEADCTIYKIFFLLSSITLSSSLSRFMGLKREFPGGQGQPFIHDKSKRFQVRNSTSYDENRIPHGWLDCPAYGQEIGCIIPSKVPLRESFNQSIPACKTYTPNQVIHQQRILGRELGLVIDLTNTSRYYDMSDWTGNGISYLKINCKGRDEVPDNASVTKFVDEVSQFCSQQKQTHSKKYILVHCTHGHNRTGYMIVHYLVHKELISVNEAISIFARARPPGIYKEHYIHELYNMLYHEVKPEVLFCPQTPEWKSSDPALNGIPVPNQVDQRFTSSHENAEQTTVMAHDDVLGDAARSHHQQKLRQLCYRALNLDVRPGGNLRFPGSHPVSLNREKLQLLRQSYYYASWKADGTRYMMLIMCDACYLIDRKFNFRKVQMRFPRRQTNEDIARKTHHYTLLDGEMVIDTNTSTGKQERRYLIYDLMTLNEKSIIELPFNQRWEMIGREVIQPREAEKRNHLCYDYNMETFHVRRKEFWFLSTVHKILHKTIPKLPHEADGVILQNWDDPYVPRTHEGLLKWKYPKMNTVDFLFETGADNCPQLFLFESERKKLMGENMVVFTDPSDPSFYSGKIIECFWDPEQHVWICMRIRRDKSSPNEFNTYKKVMRSISDNITEESLLNEIGEIVRLPMYIHRDNETERRIRHK